ncbi:MAG: DUF4266 domain-containing protein [Planctomycetes bacterium]|nr:DUF4266 domain-containing protein [Planctomycetota bacterium]
MRISQRCGCILLAGFIGLLAGGCTPVRVNQKQRLADPIMAFDHDHLHSEMMGHIITPREGAIGGFSSVGAGGCGCN